MKDEGSTDDPTASWIELITRYYNGCSAGDVDLIKGTVQPDVVHWFLAPNTGSDPVSGRDHLAAYWRKVASMIQGRWVVDSICATAEQAVIEWTMFSLPPGTTERVRTRGAEWFTRTDGLISEIRSYYQLAPTTSELRGFPYELRGYSSPGCERSAVHPDADLYGPASGRRGSPQSE